MLDLVFNIGFGSMFVGGMGWMVCDSITEEMKENAIQRIIKTHFKRFRRVSAR